MDLIFYINAERSSNNNNKNIFPETTSIAKKRCCKDGFCSLPNRDELQKQDSNDMNLFDPI